MYVLFGPSIASSITQHMVRNSDWTVEDLFTHIGALKCSRNRFARLVEAALHPLGRRGSDRLALVEALNQVFRRNGYELRVAGEQSTYPIYQLMLLTRGPSGSPKNLIFASNGPKPEIGFSDAINNDIVILSNADSCLVSDRPISRDGLLWDDLTAWWRSHYDDDDAPERSLWQRLAASLSSEAERNLFRAYFRLYRSRLSGKLPALIPQVYLHYDPAVVKRLRQRNGLPRQRMDFLLLLRNNQRIVVEVDGAHHFSRNDRPSLAAYADMVSADRDLRLFGYEVYRFGANEIVGEATDAVIDWFFSRLWEVHGVGVRAEL